MLACLERDEAVGHAFNIGNPRSAVTIFDLANRINRLAGGTGEVVNEFDIAEALPPGYRFPWEGEVLVPASLLYGQVEAPRFRPVLLGWIEGHVVIEAWPWTLWLAILPADSTPPEADAADDAG